MPSRKRTLRRKKNGLCTACGTRKAARGHATCIRCLGIDRERRLNRKAIGMCVYCGKRNVMKNSVACLRCSTIRAKSNRNWHKRNRNKRSIYDAKRAKDRRDSGQCTGCGTELYPDIDDGYIKCINCRENIHAINY